MLDRSDAAAPDDAAPPVMEFRRTELPPSHRLADLRLLAALLVLWGFVIAGAMAIAAVAPHVQH